MGCTGGAIKFAPGLRTISERGADLAESLHPACGAGHAIETARFGCGIQIAELHGLACPGNRSTGLHRSAGYASFTSGL